MKVFSLQSKSYTNNARCEGIRVANPQTKVHYLVEITTL